MKKINEYINESLVTEANGKLVVFFDHFNPDITYVIKGVNDNKLIKELADDFSLREIPYNPGSLYDIAHSDEWDYISDTKCKSESQLKTAVMKSIKDSLKDVEPDYVYVEFDPLGITNEFEEMGEGLMTEAKPEQFYKWVVEMYDESYIDGDSSSARIVWDSKNNKTVFGRMDLIVFDSQEDFENYRKENWGE